MTAKFNTHTSTAYSYEDGDLGIVLDFEPVDWIDPAFSEDGKRFAYASHDPGGREYYWPEDVHFIQADRHRLNFYEDPDEWLGNIDPETHEVFPVGVYEHGSIHYALSGESIHSGDQFDYAPVGAFIAIPKDFTDPKLAARAILEEYTSWCNGDVYGVITMKLDEESGEWEECDSCWGYIGSRYTQEEVNNAVI